MTENVAAEGPAAAPAGDRARRWLTGDVRSQDEIREAVYLFTGDVVAKQSRFWLLLVLATAIATAGVIGDATATVIGAMIIAPLATPIQGVAAAIAAGEARPLLLSTAMVVAAVAVVVGLAGLMAVVLPELHAPSDNAQITSRISPTLIDLVAAAATGLAGAVAVARRDIGDILPGVAIAISLVPPLAVVGVTGVDGDWTGAVGALLLFLTNVLAMIVVGVIVLGVIAGLRDRGAAGERFRRRGVYAVVGTAGTLVVAALVVTTIHTVNLSTWRDAADGVASAWARDRGEHLVLTRFEGDDLVFVVEGGEASPTTDAELPGLLRDVVPSGTGVIVNRVAGTRRLAAATALLSSFCAFGFTLSPAPADAAPCSRATAPTRAGAWRAYVPAGTPIRAPGRRTAITRVGAWRLVLGSARPGHACQLRVRLERRPNGASGWVTAARARLRPTRWRIEVDRDARRASLLRDGRIVGRWKVVVGKRATQTPTGLFAVQASYRTPAAS
ncbi:MAG: DUF389 domain-containing protein [Patulibacter sp.]|nr:DUF389 domain-containing protein [Patulibacter sp.]